LPAEERHNCGTVWLGADSVVIRNGFLCFLSKLSDACVGQDGSVRGVCCNRDFAQQRDRANRRVKDLLWHLSAKSEE
jgi:hypothetical protein